MKQRTLRRRSRAITAAGWLVISPTLIACYACSTGSNGSPGASGATAVDGAGRGGMNAGGVASVSAGGTSSAGSASNAGAFSASGQGGASAEGGAFALGGAFGLGGAFAQGGASSGAQTGGASAGTTARGGTGGTSAGGTSAGGALGGAGAPAVILARITRAKTVQTIDGFGTATSWGAVPPDAVIDAFFSRSKGAGLSILRNRIPFREAPSNDDQFMGGGNYTFTTIGAGSAAYKTFTLNWSNWDLSATRALIVKLKQSADYGVASYFSTPWTPPNNNTSRWKQGVTDYVSKPEVGGHLDPAHYADYADVLADYALGFQSNMGVPLSALSLQNEPNFKADYESCDWSAAQIHDFLLVLKSEFSKKGVFTALPSLTILGPEDPNFKEDLILPTLADSNTASLIGIVGVHQYEFGPANAASYVPAALPKSLAAGKRVWMTEWGTSAFGTASPLNNALMLAGLIHQDLTRANVSAFVHWWYHDLVTTDGTPNKNLWVLGQFSRFVRPGWSRLEATATLAPNVLLSAFKDASGRQFAAVAINRSNAALTFALQLDSGTLGTVTAFRTSATENMANVGTSASSGSFVNVSVAAQSVTTFVATLAP